MKAIFIPDDYRLLPVLGRLQSDGRFLFTGDARDLPSIASIAKHGGTMIRLDRVKREDDTSPGRTIR